MVRNGVPDQIWGQEKSTLIMNLCKTKYFSYSDKNIYPKKVFRDTNMYFILKRAIHVF